jgi:SWIM zinc finger
MKKVELFLALVMGASFVFPVPGLPAEEGATPQKLNKEAYFLVRQARKALYQKAEQAAYDNFIKAGEVYEELARQYPEWQADSIATKIEQCRKESDEIGRKIFKIPDGYVEIKRDMTREGNRYDKGRIDAAKVKKTGENQYEVGGNTVTLVEEGPLLGASCSCPDYTYRGRKFGFACRHIWAVVFKENLLVQQ